MTLEWRAAVDLDLHFKCSTNEQGFINEVYWLHKYQAECNSKLDVDMREDRKDNERRNGEKGQLENLYVESPQARNYEFSVVWFSGSEEQVHFNLYLTRRFCGKYLYRGWEGDASKDAVCKYEIIREDPSYIQNGQTIQFNYNYDPELHRDELDGN